MYKRNSLVLLFSWTILAIHYKDAEAGPMKRLTRMTREVYPEIEPETDGNQAQVCIVGDVVYGIEETVPAEQPCLKCKCQPPGVQCETIRCVKKPGCKAIHRPNKCCPDYQCECEHNGRIYANGERLETVPGGECKVCYCRGGEVQCAEVSCYIRNDCEGKRVPGKCCPKYDHCPPIDSLPIRNTNSTDITLTNLEQEIYENWSLTAANSSNHDQDENKIPDTSFVEVTSETKIPKNTEIEIDNLEIDNKPLTRITIHEIIPDIKEIPVTESPNPIQGELVIEEEQDFGENNSNDLVTDAEPDSSEILEVFHPPPPVLRVGDKLIFLKNDQIPSDDTSTPSSVITIIGAEGLQRGGVDDSSEVHERFVSTETSNSTNDYEPKTSESTHILSLVKRKKIQTTTTNSPLETELSTVTTTQETIVTSEIINDSTVAPSSTEPPNTLTTNGENNKTEPIMTTEVNTVNLTEATTVKLSDVALEQNPAYPPLPDVMSTISDEDKMQGGTKILPGILEIRNNKTIGENSSNSEWLKKDTTLINYKAALPEALLKELSPIDVNDTESEEQTISTTTMQELITKKGEKSESIENLSVENTDRETTTPESEKTTENTNIDASMEQTNSKESDNNNKTMPKDVEIINIVKTSQGPKLMDDTTLIHEALPKPEELVSSAPKTIGKRESSSKDETDEIFKQLDDELTAEHTERIQTKEEEEKEAEAIFKELLEETSTPKALVEPRNKETEALQRVSDALAKLTLRGKQPDSSILGILSNFFSSQYRYYDRK